MLESKSARLSDVSTPSTSLGSRLKLKPSPSPPLSICNVRSKSGNGLNEEEKGAADTVLALKSSIRARAVLEI